MFETLAIVESNRELAPGYRLLTLDFPGDVDVKPGQFAMLKAHDMLEPILRRALAVYKVHSSRRLSFLYQVLGRGTEALSRMNQGSTVEALLPLGNTWPIEKFEASHAIIVAGGIGSASVLTLCSELASKSIDTHLFLGAASEQAAIGCGLQDFRSLDLTLTLTTDDGSLGQRGFVTLPLEQYLAQGKAKGALIYSCGPWVMMARVSELAARFEVPCLVSLEAPMGCGFGVCVGCVVAVHTEGPSGYESYRRVCTDGPIFPSKAIRWEINAMH